MKAAVIGLGRIGFEFSKELGRQQPASHVGCYFEGLKMPLAVVDTDAKRLEEVSCYTHVPLKLEASTLNAPENCDMPICFYTSTEAMLDRFEPEIVSVCTPTNTHKDLVCQVAEYDCVKTIFLEKPIAQSLQEADEIIAACKEHNIKLTVDFTRRWDLMYEQLQQYEPDAIIGIHPGPLIRTGIHMLDLFNWLMRTQPYAAQAFGMPKLNYLVNDESGIWPDYNMNGIVDYADQKECVLYSGRSVEKLILFELDILMPTWRIRITENGERMEEFGVLPSHRYSGLKEYCSAKTASRVGWYPESPLLNAIKELCYQTQIHSPVNRCRGEDARLALNVALAIHYSASRANERVMLKDVPKTFTVRSY